MILVDSSVWIDLLRDRETKQVARLTDLLRSRSPVAMGDLILAEVLQGTRGPHDFERALFKLRALPLVEIAGRDVAIAAARNYQTLRGLGRTPRGVVDTLIATRCILDGHALLFGDRDFHPFVEHLGLRSALADSG